ncbi:HAD family hydrolase [Thraustotheca clavata]|uniref:HAD family hydrolase n=1 Tax=Thraustotheca clavata TaxID=74557 RepID=A0A1V9YK73_9STRA|nr:HAD family hydrolase [Thraustotheca clavata]
MGTPAHEWTRVVIDALGLSMTPEALAHAWHDHMSAKYPTCALMPGALSLVHKLPSSVKVALATSSPASAVAIKRSAHPTLFDRFDVTVCGDDACVQRGKPSPDIFLRAAHLLDVSPSKCIVIEDTAHGVTAANAAKMTAVVVPDSRFYSAKDIPGRFDHADVILPSLEAFDLSLLG